MNDSLFKTASLWAAELGENRHLLFKRRKLYEVGCSTPLPLGVSFPSYNMLRGGSPLQLEGYLSHVPI